MIIYEVKQAFRKNDVVLEDGSNATIDAPKGSFFSTCPFTDDVLLCSPTGIRAILMDDSFPRSNLLEREVK